MSEGGKVEDFDSLIWNICLKCVISFAYYAKMKAYG